VGISQALVIAEVVRQLANGRDGMPIEASSVAVEEEIKREATCATN